VAKRESPEEHENHERWLVSYADFITLLFAFFVVMYSVSRVDNKRMIDVVKSIKFAMHYKGQGGVDAMPIFDGPASEGGCMANLADAERPARS
jgi:chemotaxis protein MotB